MEAGTSEWLLSQLSTIDDEKAYFAMTLTRTSDGSIRWSTQGGWVGEGSKPMWELRAPTHVRPRAMRDAWRALGQTSVVVNSEAALAFFLRVGGNALLEDEICRRHLPDRLEPQEFVPGPFGAGPRPLSDVSEAALRYAPSKKLRMDVLRRDRFHCRVCNRTPDDNFDITLHVHHVRPHSKGGLTEMENLLTLCNSCHEGLDPHLELLLFNKIPEALSIDIDIDRFKQEHDEGVRSYRAYATELS